MERFGSSKKRQQHLNEKNLRDSKTQEHLLADLNEINPILIKCASLNNCDFDIENTIQKTKIKQEEIPRVFSNNNKVKKKIEELTLNKEELVKNVPLEEKAFKLFKIAQKHFQENRFEESLTIYNKAITLYSISPLLYARRAQIFLKLNKPMNCINDCSSALAIASDHMLARKFRGRAYMLMGEWNKAVSDLVMVENDDDVREWMEKILPMVNKIDVARNVHESEDEDRLSGFDIIEAGDNVMLNETSDIEQDMQDPEVVETLDRNPKIRKLFKKMIKMIKSEHYVMDHTEGDGGFSYFSAEIPTIPEKCLTEQSNSQNNTFCNYNDGDKWLHSIRKHANFQNLTEDECELRDSQNDFDLVDVMYPKPQSANALGDLSD